MPENGPVLEMTDVVKRYDSPGRDGGVTVLDGVSLRLHVGDATAVVGPSGSGKSTLLNLIAALDRPDAGRVLLDGENLSQLDDKRLSAVRNRSVGLVFQFHHLLPQLSLWENVLVPTLVGGPDGAEERAGKLLERVGLADRLSHRPAELSGGERQRVAVVRALINKPRLLLADEPTGSLDRAAAEDLADLLIELNREMGVTLIVATHDTDLAGRVGSVRRLCDGKLHEPEDA